MYFFGCGSSAEEDAEHNDRTEAETEEEAGEEEEEEDPHEAERRSRRILREETSRSKRRSARRHVWKELTVLLSNPERRGQPNTLPRAKDLPSCRRVQSVRLVYTETGTRTDWHTMKMAHNEIGIQ